MFDIKEKVVKSAVLDQDTINAYFPMAYDSLRELMEAVCEIKGYDVSNHFCLGHLIKFFPKTLT